DFIAVVTNDSWYGNSSGPRQHKTIGILRAVENNRSVVRCANGGISCIISPVGEVISETEMFTKDVLVGDVTIEKEITFFTKFPNLISYLSVIVSLGILIFAFIKKKFLR
ncbi:MAG: nitrilase-related carbon-nitrogen hydrolase, partial [Rhodothermaceae bacterium]